MKILLRRLTIHCTMKVLVKTVDINLLVWFFPLHSFSYAPGVFSVIFIQNPFSIDFLFFFFQLCPSRTSWRVALTWSSARLQNNKPVTIFTRCPCKLKLELESVTANIYNHIESPILLPLPLSVCNNVEIDTILPHINRDILTMSTYIGIIRSQTEILV